MPIPFTRLFRRPTVGRFIAACGKLSAIAAVLSIAFAMAANAGEIRGTVKVPDRPVQEASINPYPGVAGVEPDKVALSPTGPTDVVVFAVAESDVGAPAPTGDMPELIQINKSFDPRVLGVQVGTTVTFPNEDTVFHNVFSYSKTKRFDLGYYGSGKSKEVTFDKPGVVRVFCDIHSSMAAFIYVVDTPWITAPASDGSFSLPDLPAGTYTVHFWHPDRGESTQQVEVGDGVTTVTASL